MSSRYKDFQGKTLDAAISEACAYYGVEREKLEVEIVSDAKTGIFGLVGAKKAIIRAARFQPLAEDGPPPAGDDAAPAGKDAGEPDQRQRPAPRGKTRADKDRPARSGQGGKAAQDGAERPVLSAQTSFSGTNALSSDAAGKSAFTPGGQSARDDKKNREQARKPSGGAAGPRSGKAKHGHGDEANAADPARGQDKRDNASRREERGGRKNPPRPAERERSGRIAPPPGDDFPSDSSPEFAYDEFPDFVLEGCDRDALSTVVSDVIRRLAEPIVGSVSCVVDIRDNRVRASVDCGEASGLLVGREGHTLAAVQYLASRIVAKRIGGSVRLQIDAGNYRERQDDRLKELALSLAERVKATRRPQSTRPLSAYQRRIVHLALEGDEAVQTHSKGEGAQRRVIVQLARAGRGRKAGMPAADEKIEDILDGSGTNFSGSDEAGGGSEAPPTAETPRLAPPKETDEL